MNWTGGRLARHSGPGKNTKQKQHFARVKQNLQSHTQGKVPVQWNILNRVVEEQTGAHWRPRPVPPQLDDGHHSKRETQQPYSSIPYHGSKRKSSGKHSSRPVELQDYHEAQVRIKREPSDGLEDDIYNATPPPRDTKRRRKATDECKGESHQDIDAEERRKRLLRKGDWIASATLAPPKITFNSPTKEDKIGQRRRLTNQDRSRFDARRSNLSVAAARQRTIHPPPSSDAPFSKPLGNTDVRISIGGRVVPPGISSSAQLSKASGQSPLIQPSRVDRASLSSSVMLLDNNGNPSVATKAKEGRNMKAMRSSPPPAPVLENIWGRQESHRINGDCTSRSSRRGFISSYGSEQDRSIIFANRSYFGQCPDISVATPSPMSAIKIQAMNGHMAYSSSSAQIQHPKPQSSKVFSHFRSNSSDFAESNVAQVGVQTSASSQVLDKEIWGTWIGSLHEDSDEDQANPRGMQGVVVSPGISALPSQRKRRNYSATSMDSHSYSDIMDQRGNGSRSQSASSRMINNVERELRQDGMASSDSESPETLTSKTSDRSFERISDHGRRQVRETSYTRIKNEHETGNAHMERTAIIARNEIPGAPAEKILAHLEAKDDPDDIWKRFVFGSGDHERDSDVTSPKRSSFGVNDEEELTGLSMAAQQSIGNQWPSSPLFRRQHIDEDVGEHTPAYLTSFRPSILRSGEFEGKTDPIRQKNNSAVVRTEPSPPDDDGFSSRAFKGTIAASSLDSPAVSKHVEVHSSSSLITAPSNGSVQKQKVLLRNLNLSSDVNYQVQTSILGRSLCILGNG